MLQQYFVKCFVDRSSGRQPDRDQFLHDRAGGEASRAPARAGARGELVINAQIARMLGLTVPRAV